MIACRQRAGSSATGQGREAGGTRRRSTNLESVESYPSNMAAVLWGRSHVVARHAHVKACLRSVRHAQNRERAHLTARRLELYALADRVANQCRSNRRKNRDAL